MKPAMCKRGGGKTRAYLETERVLLTKSVGRQSSSVKYKHWSDRSFLRKKSSTSGETKSRKKLAEVRGACFFLPCSTFQYSQMGVLVSLLFIFI